MASPEKGHQLLRDGKYEEALLFYTEALAAAKAKHQKIALHSNRAACYLKLHDFKKAAEECTWVLELDQKHSGALMLRAQTFVTLKDYQSALFDVTRLMELNPDSEAYQNLEARLRTQLESPLLQFLSLTQSWKKMKMKMRLLLNNTQMKREVEKMSLVSMTGEETTGVSRLLPSQKM